MKVIEVQFEGHVRMPSNQRGTNVLRTETDTKIGESILVDDLSETVNGILATKLVEKDDKLTTHRKLYTWSHVKEVIYAPEVTERPKAAKK